MSGDAGERFALTIILVPSAHRWATADMIGLSVAGCV